MSLLNRHFVKNINLGWKRVPSAQLMMGYVLPQNMARTLTVLLGELVRHFAAGLKAPRWVRTADGVKFIDEVAE